MVKIELNFKSLVLFAIFIATFIIIKNILNLMNINNIISSLISLTFIIVGIYIVPNIINIKSEKEDVKLEREIKKIRNLLRILLLLFVSVYIIILITKDPIFGIASGTIIGLVLGLAFQPILSNLFSGLIILISGYVKVGEKIRILSNQIPYAASAAPGYKFFSEEAIPIGYKGIVKEIGIFYTTIRLISGVNLKIPNNILLSSGIIEKSLEDEIRLIKIRFEFPIRKIEDVDNFLEKIKERIKKINGIERVEALFSEQSDKEHVIIELKIDTKVEEHKTLKSEILKELIKLWKEVTKIND